MKNLLLGTAITLSLVFAPAAAQAGCTLYEHRDYGGASWYLGNLETMVMVDGEDLGCTTNGHGGGCMSYIYEGSWNDVLSSFELSYDCHIVLYEHIDEGGARWETYDSYYYVGSGWNDEVSEAQCWCA
jgi:hypothetical protein